MSITCKAINKELPRLDALKREYRTFDQTGWNNTRTTLCAAYIDAEDDAVSIRCYGVGDAQDGRDYRGETIDIFEIVEAWMEGEMSRPSAVAAIKARVDETQALNERAAELFNGKKIGYGGNVYWANMTTRAIYAHSGGAEMSGAVNGRKVADITNDWRIVPANE